MKKYLKVTIINILLFGCVKSDPSNNKPELSSTPSNQGKSAIMQSEKKQEKIFRNILKFPLIEDTISFVNDFKKFCYLHKLSDDSLVSGGQITLYKKVKLFGADQNFVILEYNYANEDNPMVSYPWKFQFVFSSDGKYVKRIDGTRIELIKVFSNQNPFLMALFSTGKGNGGHEVYKVSGDTLENVFDGFSDYFPRTYDAHGDHNINEPHELALTFSDDNRDNFNDLIFSGRIIHNKLLNDIDDIENNEVVPVKYVFLFNEKTGHFIQKENYSLKYIHLDYQ